MYVGDVILPGEIAEHCDRRMLNDAITNRMQNEMEKLSLLMRERNRGRKTHRKGLKAEIKKKSEITEIENHSCKKCRVFALECAVRWN